MFDIENPFQPREAGFFVPPDPERMFRAYAQAAATLGQVARLAAGTPFWTSHEALLLPFEALYRDALRVLVAEVPGVTGAIVKLGPLGGSHDAGPLLIPYTLAYLALVGVAAAFAFGRSDL